MAEALFQVLLDNLSSLIKKEVGLIMGVDKEMKKLSSTLTTIQAVLEDAEDRQLESKPIRNWLRKINDLAFEIEDMLDECAIEISKFEKKNSKFSLKKILWQHKIGRRMKEAAEKLDGVAVERNFHLRESSMEGQTEVTAKRAKRETGSYLNESNDVYGREEETEEIVDILVNHVKDCQQLSVLPIIGVGGLGKTTLAQLVYNNKQITKHFDLKLWVCVSDNDSDLKTLIKSMSESAEGSGRASDSMTLDSLQHRLWELLNNKRYLLILDDVWFDDQEKWAMLKNVLACGSTGASIVVTTRLRKVADIMGTLPAQCLKELSEEHCWLLFKQRAFGQEVDKHPDLEPIGRQIVKKCAGVPLAAKALGGLLRFKRKENEWIDVKESELWNLEQETTILPALRLSYRHLPLMLRRCFAYCALFPKGRQIQKEEFIHLWMAHGCIKSNGKREVEDVGDEVWNELLLRSLIQESTTYRRSIFCKMHDLVHDLALSIIENQVPGAHATDGPTASYNKIRHLYVSKSFMTLPTSIQSQVSTLSSYVNFSRLRVLTQFAPPLTIGKLKQLRLLDLSHSHFLTLPNTICDLRKLQILNLNQCYELVSLPKNMRYMDSLRHIFLEGCESLIEMPSRIGDLTSLKTLSVFIVGEKIGNQLGELEFLNLGGRLEIRHLERVKSQMDAEKANLSEKPNVSDLVLKWEVDNASGSREMTDQTVLKVLEPHKNIETLEIFGFKGRVFPVWMGNSKMNKVTEICIYNCANCLHLSPLGALPCLKSLSLVRLDMIEFITENVVEGGISFPSLEKLCLGTLPNLKGLLKEGVGETFPNLQEIAICKCSSSLILARLPSLKKLKVHECSNATLSSFSKLDNLTSLELILDESTICIPNETLESLSNLKELRIHNAHEHILPVECLQCLKSLTDLMINMRDAVTCLPGEWLRHLTALEDLSIYFCIDLVELPDEIKYLHSLKTLMLQSLPELVCLPEAIQHLHSLRSLALTHLDQLSSLPDWLDKLMSLDKLDIKSCPRIATLPSSIQRMTNLQSLVILGCPELIMRCEKGKGEDWQKIAHIPNLSIG